LVDHPWGLVLLDGLLLHNLPLVELDHLHGGDAFLGGRPLLPLLEGLLVEVHELELFDEEGVFVQHLVELVQTFQLDELFVQLGLEDALVPGDGLVEALEVLHEVHVELEDADATP